MRFTLENILAILLVMLSEAWFLNDFLSENLSFDSVITFVSALCVLFAKDAIKERIGISDDNGKHDLELFYEFQRVLPVEPTVRALKDMDFGNSFPRAYIEPLFCFVETWDTVDKEFQNRKIEKGKKALYKLAEKLAREFALRTAPVGRSDYISVLPDALRGDERPAHVIEDAKILNRESTQFVPQYENFIRMCRKSLKL